MRDPPHARAAIDGWAAFDSGTRYAPIKPSLFR
jgi:hypothetical protein